MNDISWSSKIPSRYLQVGSMTIHAQGVVAVWPRLVLLDVTFVDCTSVLYGCPKIGTHGLLSTYLLFLPDICLFFSYLEYLKYPLEN